jgi:hypothetical protein
MKNPVFVPGLLCQSWYYAQYSWDKRDMAVALFALLFLAVCLLPALILDVAFLLLKVGQGLAQAGRQVLANADSPRTVSKGTRRLK